MIAHRFLFGHEELERVASRWVEQDMREAQLPRLFRLYYHLRPFIPIAVRQRLQRRRTTDADEHWFLSRRYVNCLGEVAAKTPRPIRVIHPWPDKARSALVVTHDVETAEGLKNVDRIATIEEDTGVRSSWNIVPYKYPLDTGLIRDLKDRGFEIGVHGYNHDGKLFKSKSIFRRRVAKINEAIDQFGAVGFRTPMVHRNLNWMQQLDIRYDSSCFDIDPYQSMPGGVGSIWPFLAGKFVELPYTLPQDHTLLVARVESLLATWQKKVKFIRKYDGMVLMLTHPDYLTRARDLAEYREFLEWAVELPHSWHALPSVVATWWRQRQASRIVTDYRMRTAVAGPAACRARVAEVTGEDGQLQITDGRADRGVA